MASFRLRAPSLHSFADVLLNLDQIAAAIGQVLGALVAGDGVRHVATWGTSTVAFTASTDSAVRTISHGLGNTPGVVQCVCKDGNFGQIPRFTVNNANSTSFDVYGEVRTAFTGTATFYFYVIA